ncbi:hypothetical protein HY413_00485 [Candidatus Kaiserbacteria bacterium]|nr:hypothetical protein [Candidatus Kaiserbacteria bacterium]
MDRTTKKILEVVTDIQDKMATKEDIQDIQDQINNHTRQIEANTKAIAEMSQPLRSVFGYAKEIDLLMANVKVLTERNE